MVPLGWAGGVVGLILATAISLYANALIARLHEYGGTRHIRYRDLAGFIYGIYLSIFFFYRQILVLLAEKIELVTFSLFPSPLICLSI